MSASMMTSRLTPSGVMVDPPGPAPYSRAWIEATKRGGVAGCMTWAPDYRKELTVWRPHKDFGYSGYPSTWTSQLRHNRITPPTYATSQATQTTSRDAAVAQLIDDDVIMTSNGRETPSSFERHVIQALHDSGGRDDNDGRQTSYGPRPPTGAPRHTFVNNRRVTVMEHDRHLRRREEEEKEETPPNTTVVVVQPDDRSGSTRVIVNGASGTQEIESQRQSHGSKYGSKNYRHHHHTHHPEHDHYRQKNDYSYYEDRPGTAAAWKQEDLRVPTRYDVIRQQQAVTAARYDVMKQEKQLADMRAEAANERKRLMDVYQTGKNNFNSSVKAGVSAQENIGRATSLTPQLDIARQQEALVESRMRLAQLLDKREHLQRQQLQLSGGSNSSSSYGTYRDRRISCDSCVDDDVVGSHSVTLYNPGRQTPLGRYCLTDDNRLLSRSCSPSVAGLRRGAGRGEGEGGEPRQVNVKVECQPNTDTVLSLRVQSRPT